MRKILIMATLTVAYVLCVAVAAAPGTASAAANEPDTTPKDPPFDEALATDSGDPAAGTISVEGEATGRASGYQTRSCGEGFTVTDREARFLELVNDKRHSQGKSRMCASKKLMRSSQYWTNYMARYNDYYHGGLKYVCTRFDFCHYSTLFENIYYGTKVAGAERPFDAYLASDEGHREALLGENRDRFGTAFKENEWWTFNTVHLSND